MALIIAKGSNPLSKPRLLAIVVTLMLVEVLGSFENAMIITALPKINAEFNDISSVGWLITAFVIAQAGTAAIGGRLGDLFGRRLMLIAIVALCGVGSLISAVAPSLAWIVAGRVVQGVSGAVLPLCYGMTREIAPSREVPFWVGCLTGAYALAHAIGFVLGGALADLGGWHMIFYCNAAYALILLLPMIVILPPSTGTAMTGKLDFGGLLFVPAVAAILFGITKAAEWGWTAARTWSYIVGGAVLMALWVWREVSHATPLIDVKLLARRNVLLPNLCFGLLALGTVQAPLVMMMILQQPLWTGVGLGVTATFAGLVKLPSSLSGAVASPLSGYICGRWGGRIALVQGAAICSLAWLYLFFFHDSVFNVIIGTVLIAIGTNMLLTAVPNLILDATPIERSSEATGLSMVIKAIFIATGVQMVTGLLATSRVHDPHTTASFASEAAYSLTFGVLAASAVMMLILGLFIRPGTQIANASVGAGVPQE
jgi:MFS family permease